MAFFKQLRLLLKHKILLRRRQPTTLLLELFWPAFVFLAILVVRWHFPATFKQTCYYSAKALPSAGMVNLMQSYVCALDNPCLNSSEYQEVPNYPNASIHAIVDQLLPLVTNKNVTKVINDLPKGIRLIAAIIDTLSVTSVQNLLEDGFPLRQALRPSGWQRVQRELDRLEATVVPISDLDLVTSAGTLETRNSTISSYDILVNSSLNLIQLGIQSDNAGFRSVRSFRDVICDDAQLEQFLIVPQRHYVRLLSRRLCLLERKDLYHLFDLVQENIDFAQILEQLSTVLRSVGLNEHQQHVDNIIAMIGTIDRANIFRSVSALRNTSWMYDMPSLFSVLRSGDIDTTTLLKIVSDIEPIFYNDDSLASEQSRKASEDKQQQELEYLMKFYNSDDSTLKSVAEWSFGEDSGLSDLAVTTSTEFPIMSIDSDLLDRDETDDNTESLQNLGDAIDLDASESHLSASSSTADSSTSRRNAANLQNESLSRKFLPKLVGNMDRLIDGTESFTKTPHWESLLSAFQGLQMLLEMADDDTSKASMASKSKLSSMNIEKFILTLPKKIQTFNNFFNSLIPEKFQPLLFPLFNLFHRASDSMLQHLSGAFSRALAEDKIFFFDKFAHLLLYSIQNGTFPRKCIDIQQAMCNFETFQSVFVVNEDEETGESTVLFEEDPGTLQGIQELGCLFFGQNYWQEESEESTPILAKLYYTLSTLNETNLLASLSPSPNNESTNNSTTSGSSDNTFWTNFTSRMLEVYLLATKSVAPNLWTTIWHDLRHIWKSNGFTDRAILLSRITQLSADCFIPNGIIQSSIWRAIYRKKAIAHELLNVLLGEINSSTETEALKVEQVAMGSLTLADFLRSNLHIFPTLIDGAFETLFFSLPQFVEKMFQVYPYYASGWPCNRHSIVNILSFKSNTNVSQIKAAESFICQQLQLRPGEVGRIVDELVQPSNNESRIAPLIRAIQNKSLNLTAIHENLPPLDWVEAATSLSLIKESAEKILSMENSLAWFPEVDQLDDRIRGAFNRGHDSFIRFYNQGTAGMLAYLGDIVSPFANRYLSLNETFSRTCDMGVAGVLMAPVYNDKEWRCLFITLKYTSYTINHLFDLVNDVLRNFLLITAQLDETRSSELSSTANADLLSCTLLSNSTSNRFLSLLDNIPEVLELVLNEVLLGDIDRLSRSTSLRSLLCASNLNLDTFGPRSPLYANVRASLCALSAEVSSCSSLTMPDRWRDALDYLNVTWYHRSPDSLTGKASFSDAYHNVYHFLTLFGQFSPRTFNRFIAKYESADTQQYIGDTLKRMNRLEYFRNRRFVYVMQTVSKEVNGLLFDGKLAQRHTEERRDLLMALVYAFNELPTRLRQRYRLGAINVKTPTAEEELLNVDLLDSLLDWIDSHLLVASETFLQTITLDSPRLEKLFHNRYDTVTIWRSFCRSPVSQFVVVDNQISVGAHKAKEEICQLDFNAVFDQWYRSAKPYLANHTDHELISLLLVKVGTVLDLILKDSAYKRHLLKSEDWQPILSKLSRLVLGSSESESGNGWLIDAVANFAQSLYPKASIDLFHQAMRRFECGFETVPAEGLNWEQVPSVYYNKTGVMAAYSTLNSAFMLGSIGLNTFLAQAKFYKHLQMLAKSGRFGFCQLKSEHDFEEVFATNSMGSSTEAIAVLRTLQRLVCRPMDNLLYHLNPVSKCFDLQPLPDDYSLGGDLKSLKLKFASLFAQNRNRNEVEFDEQLTVSALPPILDLKQWNSFFKWWKVEVAPYPNSGRTLLAMRAFQLVDVYADNHVIWKAFYRLTFIFSEMFAYSLRALQLSESMYPMKPDLQLELNAQLPVKVAKHISKKGLSSLLTSTMSNLIFPEVNHFITFATFRQLRWIRHISHFFAKQPDILHDEMCPTLNSIHNQKLANSSASSPIIVDDDFNDLLLLLCHNHPSDWIYTLTFKSNLFNIKTSPRPKFISHRRIRERIGKLTQVLARMLDYNSHKNNKQLDHVIRFLKLKQLESLENVAGTVTILTDTIVATQKSGKGGYIKSSIRELVNTGWRSVPALLDAVDQYICSYKRQSGGSNGDDEEATPAFVYRPKAPDMRVVMCEMPRWDFDRAYSYLSEHLDLKNMLQDFASSRMLEQLQNSNSSACTKTARCVTPLRFLSRWVDVGQDIFEQLSTSSFWSELKSCRRRHLLSLLASSKSSRNNFLLKHSLRYVRFMNGVLSTVDKFSRDSKGASWSNVRELWRTFSYFVLNQVPAYVPITDIVRHDVNLPEYLNATLDRVSTLSRSRAKQAIRLLTDSLLDINAVSWHNFSNIALKEMICKDRREGKGAVHGHIALQAKHYLPLILAHSKSLGGNASLLSRRDNGDTSQQPQEESLYETLCQSANVMQIIDSLISVMDQKSIASRLSELQRSELTRGEWMSDVLMPEMSQLSEDMLASGMMAEVGSKLAFLHSAATAATGSYNQVKSESASQKGINHLLISFVSFTRAKNFSSLYDTIKHAIDKLMPRFSEGPIVDSLSRILEGLRSLKDLSNRGLFQIKYQISDLLLNVENVKIFLELNLGLSKAYINQIVNATLDLSEFIEMSASISFDSSAFCNRSLLFGQLKLEMPPVSGREPVASPEMVTNALCTLSVTEDFKFNNQILNQLVIRKLTNNMVNLIMNGLLKKASIQNNEIGKALNAVKASSKAMPHVKKFIRDMSRSLDGFHSDSSIEQLNWNSMSNLKNISLTHTSDLIGKVMCGRALPALNREMKLLKVKVQQPKISQAELSSFSSDFCRNGYRQIMAMQGGAVIWNGLKPLLLGKILYTPKAPATDAIMSHMNTTLRFMPRIVEMLHAWSQTLSSLETFYYHSNVNHRMSTVKHLIESVFVNGEADGLFDDIDTFNVIEKMTRSGNVLAILKLIGQVAQCASFDRFVGLDSELQLEEYARNLTRSHEFIAGLVFVGAKGQFSSVDTLPENVEYKIRIDIDFVPSSKALKARIWEPGPRDNYATELGYLHGFVQIQEMVDRSIMAYLTNRTVLAIDPEVHLQQQPYLCFDIDKFGNYIRSLAPLITTMAWIFLIAHLIREHVLERELHLEEVMRVMGLKSGVAWFAWCILGISVMAFATLCGISLLTIGQLIPASDPVLLFLFFMVFNVSLLMFCYMMSSFFKTATIAALSGIVAYLASFLPFMVAITLENDMTLLHKVLTCFSMSTSFCFGMMYMTRFEVQGVGMQWNNLWHSPMQGDPMNVGTAMIMMLVDSVLYFLIAWYISHVSPPGNNARRYPWFFFLSLNYWKYDFTRSFGFGEDDDLNLDDSSSIFSNFGDNQKSAISRNSDEDNVSVEMENEGAFNIIDPEEIKSIGGKGFDFLHDDAMITDELGTLKTISGTLRKAIQQATLTRKPSTDSTSTISQAVLGMELRGLYVIYNERSNRSKHMAVSNLNLTLKEGQITTILGRNGAGKTTTINVLTGQMPPTTGTVTIYGHRIPEDFGRARRLLGYCPQYNTLFNNLTVREHLMFFAELKGLLQDEEAITRDVDDILQNMGLWSLQHQMAKHLSGGLKRRLCVALAFVGGSKLIILDEPTSSVDPVARRSIWDLIVQQKKSRTVLLTTHHMDEAEILSDEVAVIHRGKLLCVGSPLLLKSKYGCGYQLTVSRQGVSLENVPDDGSVGENLSVRFGVEEDEGAGHSMSTSSEMSQSDVDRLMAFTKCLIPNASFVEDNGEVILSLPQYDDHGVKHDYATFFRCLDSNIRTLGFGSYGVTSTTLEEVFLTLCNLEESNMPVDEAKLAVARRMSYSANGSKKYKSAQPKTGTEATSEEQEDSSFEVELDSGLHLKGRQLYALLTKRFLHMARDWKLLFCTLFLPCLFIAFAMAMTLIKPSFAPDPALPLLPQMYGQNTISFVSNLAQVRQHTKEYPGELLRQLRAIENELAWDNQSSIDCLQPRENWRSAKCPILYTAASTNTFLPPHLLSLKGKVWDSRSSRKICRCAESCIDMATMAYLIPLPASTAYGLVYNLSRGVNVNNFLLRTQPEFMDRRWGGWTLHPVGNYPKTRLIATAKNNSQSVQSRPARPLVKVWFDNTGFHSMPAYLSALNNAILRANLQASGMAVGNASKYRITTYSHPLHVRSTQLGDQSVMQQAGDAGIAIIILVGFIFIPTSFVFYIVRERLCEEKHLQRTFGVGPCLYWLSSLLWDVTVLLVAIGLASAIIAFFRLPIYMARLNLPAILSLLFFFGWAMLNLVYLLEKLFSEPSIAFMVIYCLALFVGIHTMVVRLMIDVFKLVDLTPTFYRLFEKVAVIFPPYLLLSGIVDVHRNQLFADIFLLFDQDVYVNPFSMEMLGRHFSIFFIEGCLLFLLNLAIECGVYSQIRGLFLRASRSKLTLLESASSAKGEDNDVAEERRRVNLTFGLTEPEVSRSHSASPSGSSSGSYSDSSCSVSSSASVSSDILRVFGVTKVFESIFGHKRAVNNVTFSVPRGEAFGLLGVNGAGKTTLFRILTGQVKATTGEASFSGQPIRDALVNGGCGSNNNSIGYCPQADALDDFLTPVEHLTVYAHLRGILRQNVARMVKESIEKFQLQPHADMPVQALSRGNRRKLCLAIAMLGNPRLVLLDEPTSGLDPQSRRYVCETIQNAVRHQRSVLLTSHSMEECDILCSRLAIMVNGQFKCIGSPQYLKHKFGTGYIITLRLSEVKSNFKEAIEYIREHFSQSILRAHHHTMLEFNLPTNDVPLSTIFQVLQKAQTTLSLQDYSVSQTTLDQVFVSFASQQVNDESYEMEENTKVPKTSKTPTAASKEKSTTLSRKLSENLHDTKINFKQHASMLMSLCHAEKREKDKVKVPVQKLSPHSLRLAAMHQAQLLPSPKSAVPPPPSMVNNHLKHNLLLSTMLQRAPNSAGIAGKQAMSSLKRVNSQLSAASRPYLKDERFWTISGHGRAVYPVHPVNGKKNGTPHKGGVGGGNKVFKAKRNGNVPLGGGGGQSAMARFSMGSNTFAATLPSKASLQFEHPGKLPGGGGAGNPTSAVYSLRKGAILPPGGGHLLEKPVSAYEFSRMGVLPQGGIPHQHQQHPPAHPQPHVRYQTKPPGASVPMAKNHCPPMAPGSKPTQPSSRAQAHLKHKHRAPNGYAD